MPSKAVCTTLLVHPGTICKVSNKPKKVFVKITVTTSEDGGYYALIKGIAGRSLWGYDVVSGDIPYELDNITNLCKGWTVGMVKKLYILWCTKCSLGEALTKKEVKFLLTLPKTPDDDPMTVFLR